MEQITQITYLLFVFLILAIFVERSVEVCVSIFKYLELKLGWSDFWNKKANKSREQLEKLYRNSEGDNEEKHRLLNWIHWQVVIDRPYEKGKDIISAAGIRLGYIRVGARVLAFIFSLTLTIALDINLMDIISNIMDGTIMKDVVPNFPGLKTLISAAALSIGSEPLHQFISNIEKTAQTGMTEASKTK